LRRFHDATSGTELAGLDETVRHGDVSPTNVVWRDGSPIALLDFDQSEPGARIDDVAYMCWTFVLAGRDDEGLVGTRLRARRLRLLCDAYGLHQRNGILDVISRQQIATKALVVASSAQERNKRSPGDVRATAQFIDAEIDWLQEHAVQLAAELVAP
jgi:aminoglycoside phosphotransferase (APT) family kinase protein